MRNKKNREPMPYRQERTLRQEKEGGQMSIFQPKKKTVEPDAVPTNVEQAIPIQGVFEDGIFLVGRNLWSKTFTFTDINYVTNSHPAIISREVFEAAQQRLKEREQYAPKKPKQQYLLTRMIYCDECGWAYKRRVQNGITYWVCSRKGNSGHECGGKNLLESEIFSSFIIMYNRLRQYETLLVDNTLTQLIDIRTRLVSGSQEIAQIDAEIAKLCSQNDMYSKLRAKNIMDEVSYAEQTAELQNRITTLRSRRLKLISEDEDTHYIEDLRFLKELLQSYPPAILSFDENLFTAIVERIKADDNGNITFVLKGGLNLKESVGVAA